MFVSTEPFISSLFGVVLSEVQHNTFFKSVQYVWLSGDVSMVTKLCLYILKANTFFFPPPKNYI